MPKKRTRAEDAQLEANLLGKELLEDSLSLTATQRGINESFLVEERLRSLRERIDELEEKMAKRQKRARKAKKAKAVRARKAKSWAKGKRQR